MAGAFDDFPMPPSFQRPDEVVEVLREPDGTVRYLDVEYSLPFGFRPLRLDLTIPPAAGESVPVVLFFHGGAFLMGSKRSHFLYAPIRDALLRRGIAVATVEYRLSGEALFPALVQDGKAAVRWLRRFGPEVGVRPDSIGVWGESAGAHLAAFLALNGTDAELIGTDGVTGVSSDVQAGVAWYAPTQFRTMDAQAPADAVQRHDPADSPESLLIGGAVGDHPEEADFASPVSHVAKGAAPLLLLHGLRDRVVPHQQSEVLAQALGAAGADVTLELIDGAGHVFEGVDPAPIIERSAQFLADGLTAGRD